VSNLENSTDLAVSGGRSGAATEPVFELLTGRPVVLTPRRWTDDDGAPLADPMNVVRFLPGKGRRMVGAWCFVDYYGPDDVSATDGMLVPPHPHCGLQTVSWLLGGEVLHRDSLGNSQLIAPSQLNLMTAGAGIAHAETSAQQRSPLLHGVQLWIALPDAERNRLPAFEHHPVLPRWQHGGLTATVLLGELSEAASPALTYTPLVGADVDIAPAAESEMPLHKSWEYAVLVTAGEATIDGRPISQANMAYLGCGRERLEISSASGGRLLLIGGEPFDEEIVMWWNFVGRSHADIAEAREAWMSGDRFGVVNDYDGAPLPAPPIPPVRLKPRGRR
jgi:redox-sensitive bicupin YhaK (pirin superfamily)